MYKKPVEDISAQILKGEVPLMQRTRPSLATFVLVADTRVVHGFRKFLTPCAGNSPPPVYADQDM